VKVLEAGNNDGDGGGEINRLACYIPVFFANSAGSH